jgi:hypothetical protein
MYIGKGFFGENNGDSDRLFTCRGHLGWRDKNKNDPISSVELPKVAKAGSQMLLSC